MPPQRAAMRPGRVKLRGLAGSLWRRRTVRCFVSIETSAQPAAVLQDQQLDAESERRLSPQAGERGGKRGRGLGESRGPPLRPLVPVQSVS